MYPNGRGGRAADPVGSPKREGDIDCFSCRYFFITYDPQFPYGCRAARFKSRRIPSMEVFLSSGIDCQFFAGKVKNR
jgi:hypothetical protein